MLGISYRWRCTVLRLGNIQKENNNTNKKMIDYMNVMRRTLSAEH